MGGAQELNIFYNIITCRPDGYRRSSLNNQAISDKWTVEALKEYLRKHRGRVSGKKADLVERFVFC